MKEKETEVEKRAARKRLAEMNLLDDFLFGTMVSYPVYHGKLAVGSLESGQDYDRLKNVVIIMIVPYDPFGLGRMVYTIKNHCVEEPDMPYEDGARTLFLYTRGTKGVQDEALRQLLHYMEETTYENAVNEDLQKLHKMVERVKKDPEVTVRYMLTYLREMERLNKATAKAMEAGHAAGHAAGIEEGMEAGRVAGELYQLVSLVCKKRKKQKPQEEIAEDLEEEISVIEPIYHAAEKFAPEYDPKLVFEQINADNKQEKL